MDLKWISRNDEQLLLDILNDRNLMVHTCKDDLAKSVADNLCMRYAPAFASLLERMKAAISP